MTLQEENERDGLVRTLVMGDIHGCFNEMRGLMNKADYNGNRDRLILIGDYIDRGLESYLTVEYIKRLQQAYGSNVVCLMGNHEDLLIKYLESGDESERDVNYRNWMQNGAETTLKSWELAGEDIKESLGWFKSLGISYETDDYYFVHAGVDPSWGLEEQLEDDQLWIREKFIGSDKDMGKTIIFGHTPIRSFYESNRICKLQGNKIDIDTGCVFGGKLSCLELPRHKIYSVESSRR